MACWTRLRVARETSGLPLITRETVPMPTPAARATSLIVGIEVVAESTARPVFTSGSTSNMLEVLPARVPRPGAGADPHLWSEFMQQRIGLSVGLLAIGTTL